MEQLQCKLCEFVGTDEDFNKDEDICLLCMGIVDTVQLPDIDVTYIHDKLDDLDI